MNIKYLITKHDIGEKAADDTAPIFGIVLMDMDNIAEKKEYGMSRQLKDFSLAMQKYGLAWSERYKEYVIPDDICFQKDKFKQYIALIEDIFERFNRGENIVSENEQQREQQQSYYTKETGVKYLQEFIHFHLSKTNEPIVLDPAAGVGNLIDGLKVSKSSIWAIEPDIECCKQLKQKGYEHVVNTDFETAVVKKLIPRPTHIIMNPPFSKQQDIKFYNLACRLLPEGGVISAIVSENSIYEELERYGLTLDCNTSKRQAIEILGSTYVSKLSNHMREFLQHIANSQWISLDDVTTDFDFGFEHTHARAFYIRGIIRQREKDNDIKIVHYDEGR